MSEQINLEEILKKELIPVVFAHSPEMTYLATLRAMNEACKQVLVLASKRVDKTIEDSEEEVYIVLSQEINYSILDTIRQIV